MLNSFIEQERAGLKSLWIVICLLGFNVEPSLSSCSSPSSIKNGTISLLKNLKPISPDERYPEKTEIKVECDPGFQLRNLQFQIQTCINGVWTLENGLSTDDGPVCVPFQCGRPPSIRNGYYTNEISRWKTGKAEENYTLGTVLEPGCDMSYFLNCSKQCGRIVCSGNGVWTPRDSSIITECVNSPLNPKTPVPDRGMGNETTLKHYLVIVLAIVCIFIVCGITVVLLRRPNFCKKQNTRGGRSSGGGTFAGGCEDNPIIITSSSPIPDPLNSLPVAMNTGIFVPGAGYDWQECRFQESTLTVKGRSSII